MNYIAKTCIAVLLVLIPSYLFPITSIADQSAASGILDAALDDTMKLLTEKCPSNPYVAGLNDVLGKFKGEAHRISPADLAGFVFGTLDASNGNPAANLYHDIFLKSTKGGFYGTPLHSEFYPAFVDDFLTEFTPKDLVLLVIGPVKDLMEKMKSITGKVNKRINAPISAQDIQHFEDMLDCYADAAKTIDPTKLFTTVKPLNLLSSIIGLVTNAVNGLLALLG